MNRDKEEAVEQLFEAVGMEADVDVYINQGIFPSLKKKATKGIDSIWREAPIPFDDFVTHPEHMGQPPLSERQSADLRDFLGVDPKTIFLTPETQYHELILLWGKGGGKDWIISMLQCWIVHILLCMHDPRIALQMGVGENIDILNVAYSEDQAKNVFFAKFKGRLLNWEWLSNRYLIIDSGTMRNRDKHPSFDPKKEGNENRTVTIGDQIVKFPFSITAHSAHSQNESYEGKSLLFWTMDEASAFRDRGKHANGDAVYGTLRTSANTRFPRTWRGAIISYPRYRGDFTMRKYDEAIANPDGDALARKASTWEVNPKVKKSDFLLDYETRPEESRAKYECAPPGAEDPFMPEEAVLAAFQPNLPSLILTSPAEVRGSVLNPATGLQESRIFTGKVVDAILTQNLRSRAPRVVGIDGGLVRDRAGMTIAHGEPQEIVNTNPETGDVQRFVVNKVIVDALLVWTPDKKKGLRVSLNNITSVVLEIHKELQVSSVAYDHWNSQSSIEALQMKGIFVEAHNVNTEDYAQLRELFNLGAVVLPCDRYAAWQLLQKELTELMRVITSGGKHGFKVDHPETGCFVGTTRVPLLDGTDVEIKDLDGKEVWVYSMSPDRKIVPGKARGRLTKHVTRLLDVVLDSGAVIRCTPEHPFMLRDGTYKPACELRPALDGLMPLMRQWPVDGGYERLGGNRVPRSMTHHIVWTHFNGDIPKGYIIHHANHIKTDNRPENLELIDRKEHLSIHAKIRWETDEAYAKAVSEGTAKFNKLDSTKEKRRLSARWYGPGWNAKKSGSVTIEKVKEVALTTTLLVTAENVATVLGVSKRATLRVVHNAGYSGWLAFVASIGANHKVRAIYEVVLDVPVPVYDLEVDEWHNFGITAGIFVHNSKDLADSLANVSRLLNDPSVRSHAQPRQAPRIRMGSGLGLGQTVNPLSGFVPSGMSHNRLGLNPSTALPTVDAVSENVQLSQGMNMLANASGEVTLPHGTKEGRIVRPPRLRIGGY